jgi:hypothetical protein
MSNKVKYPNISVNLLGGDGNAFAIIGKVNSALRRGGVPQSQIKKFTNEAMEGDYNHLLRTAMRWVEVE